MRVGAPRKTTRTRAGTVAAILAGTLFFVVQLHGEGIHCWVRCKHPPRIQSANDVPCALRDSSNPPLTLLARATGILTTYLGKMLGIQGWRDYKLPASVNGFVVHAAGSTDLFYTIDVKIESLTVGSRAVNIAPDKTFIRVEVLPQTRFGAPIPVAPDQRVCISGRLMWDADGFLEIHPNRAADIKPHSCQ